MLVRKAFFVTFFVLPLSVLLPTALATSTTTCDGDSHHIVANSSEDLKNAANSQSPDCTLISILPDRISLSGVVRFEGVFNLSIVGQEASKTVIDCQPNSGFTFADSHLIQLENLVFVSCSMNDTYRHTDTVAYPFIDLAAVYFCRSSNVAVRNCRFERSRGTGLILYEVVGSNIIEHSHFVDNRFDETAAENFTSGGLIICKEFAVERAVYVIRSSHFEGNANREGPFVSNAKDLGGAVTLLLGASGNGSVLSVANSTFLGNEAYHGAGLLLLQTGSNNVVNVSNTTFDSNTGKNQGGGMYILNRARSTTFNVSLHSCVFTRNFAQWIGGLGSYAAADSGHVKITAYNTNWTRNGANSSGLAIGLQDDHDQSVNNATFFIEATLVDCWICNNTGKDFKYMLKSTTGAVFASRAKVVFRGGTMMRNNYGSALFLLKSANATFEDTFTVFAENTANHGGAIYMKNSAIHLPPSNATVYFDSNVATLLGGAIHADVGEYDHCIFDFLTSPGSNDSSPSHVFPNDNPSVVWFIDNTADNYKKIGQSIYVRGNNPTRCFHATENGEKLTKLRLSPFHYIPNSTETVLFDASSVVLKSLPPLSANGSVLKVMLGEEFSLVPTVLDTLKHNTTGVAYLSLAYQDSESSRNVTNESFTYIGPNLMGLDEYSKNNILHIEGDSDTHCNLTLEVLFNKNEAGYRFGYTKLDIEVVPCRLGFVYDSKTNSCKCFKNDRVLCPDTHSACVRNGYWFGKAGSDHRPAVFLCDNHWCDYMNRVCPTRSCKNAPDFCALGESESDNSLCWEGRGGTFCSRCKEGYAFTFSAFQCVPDSTCRAANTALVLLSVIAYWLLVIFVLFVLLSVNSSAGTGLSSGIVYYFSVAFLLTDNVLSDRFLQILLKVGTTITQLDTKLFGEIPVCFARNWDRNVHHDVFGLASPLFVGAALLAIVLYSRHCRCPKRISLAENSPNHAMCKLIVFSYTALTYSCFQILRPIRINDGVYTYSDPDVPYLDPERHLPYMLVAIAIEVFISLPICLFLLFAPCLSKWRRVNLVKLRLKPIVDDFQAAYRDNCRWFAGFYFLARQLMYLAYIIPEQVLPQSNSLLHIVCVFVLLVQTTVRPYKDKYWYLNIFDTFLLTDILLLALFPINSSLNSTQSLPSLMRLIQRVCPYVLILFPSLSIFFLVGFLLLKRLYRWWRKNAKEKRLTVLSASDKAEAAFSAGSGTSDNCSRDLEDELCQHSVSFFKDPGEREPLLSEMSVGRTVSPSLNSKKKRRNGQEDTETSGFTTSSLRVASLRPFPPTSSAYGGCDKAATS